MWTVCLWLGTVSSQPLSPFFPATTHSVGTTVLEHTLCTTVRGLIGTSASNVDHATTSAPESQLRQRILYVQGGRDIVPSLLVPDPI